MPTVVHHYLTKCITNQPPGFADFIRGTLVLYQKAKKYGYTLEIDYSHPILAFLKNKTDKKYDGFVYEVILPISFSQQDVILNNFFSSGKDFQLLTHILPQNFYNTPLDQDTKNFLKWFLTPTDDITQQVELLKEKIGGDYIIVHVRTGDSYMMHNSVIERNDLYEKAIGAITKSKYPTVLLSDDKVLREKIANNVSVFQTDTIPSHSGGYSDTRVHMRDVMIDFSIISGAKYIYCVTTIGSGFSYMPSIIYDIPFENINPNVL